ncbi:MAG: glutamate racemase [Bacteroidota bacterium]
MNNKPIGVFDSGIGGLTVARAIKKLLPNESLIYFGDTAHLPYGDKSEAAIQAYSIKITDVLLEKNCKAIVVACNSASASAYNLLQEYAGKRVEIVNVIDPMIEFVNKHFRRQTVGVIGTKRTVESNIYSKKLKVLNNGIICKSLATPLLVPMIEEGFFNQRISHDIIDNYLSSQGLADIKALILGCTHYPLIKEEVTNFLEHKVEALDSSEITANFLGQKLAAKGLLASEKVENDEFMVSDFTQSFESSTKLFFGELIHLTLYKLWE